MEHKTEENGHACQEERGGGLVQDLCKVKEQLTRSQYWKNQYYDVEAQYITLLKQFQLMLKKMQRVEDRMLRMQFENKQIQQERASALSELERMLNERVSTDCFVQYLQASITEVKRESSEIIEIAKRMKDELHISRKQVKSLESENRDLRRALKNTERRRDALSVMLASPRSLRESFTVLISEACFPTAGSRESYDMLTAQKSETPSPCTSLKDKAYTGSDVINVNGHHPFKHLMIYKIKSSEALPVVEAMEQQQQILVNLVSNTLQGKQGKVEKVLLDAKNQNISTKNFDIGVGVARHKPGRKRDREGPIRIMSLQPAQRNLNCIQLSCEKSTNNADVSMKMHMFSPSETNQVPLVPSMGWYFLRQLSQLQLGNLAIPKQSENARELNLLVNDPAISLISRSPEKTSREERLLNWLHTTAVDVGNTVTSVQSCYSLYHSPAFGNTANDNGRQSGNAKGTSQTGSITTFRGGQSESGLTIPLVVLHGQLYGNSPTNHSVGDPAQIQFHSSVGSDNEGQNCTEDSLDCREEIKQERSRGLGNAEGSQSSTSKSPTGERETSDCCSDCDSEKSQGRVAAVGVGGLFGAAAALMTAIVVQGAKRL